MQYRVAGPSGWSRPGADGLWRTVYECARALRTQRRERPFYPVGAGVALSPQGSVPAPMFPSVQPVNLHVRGGLVQLGNSPSPISASNLPCTCKRARKWQTSLHDCVEARESQKEGGQS